MGFLDRFRKKQKENLWTKCDNCKSILYVPELKKNLGVCPSCQFHFHLSTYERANSIFDGQWVELFSDITPLDPLGFKDTKPYQERLKQASEQTGLSEAMTFFEGMIGGKRALLGVLDFAFIGGSMGSVVGERFYRACLKAGADLVPLIVILSSGGARMQEGILSLMQMAKTSIGVEFLRSKRVPYISVLTDPTLGGVAASFASLGDVVIAEPGALIGFAGPRVIEQTIKQQLPEGFQRAEFLLQKGMVDMVVHRKDLKPTLETILQIGTFWRENAVRA
ncbi:MAG: acetyl-CoA carboxylase, carboxyltransferase subunit beta [Aquificaceae bacterium]|nr:acetyl-CoA carboxylase, carboxyltransferase subunit beta [Aquificaceae bacterium]MDW8237353.1 acetyl-CoA carboxylase, carboxyltransferase subunit beta [Aquificaceae bacterium]